MKGFTAFLLVTACLAGAGPPAFAGDRAGLDGSAVRKASKPGVVCLGGSGTFSERRRPGHCSFYDARAPDTRIFSSADFPTRGVSWSHWGSRTAIGRGRYHVPGRWLPMRVELLRPKVACGRRVFTRVRMDLKTCATRWSGWNHPIAIKTCTEFPE